MEFSEQFGQRWQDSTLFTAAQVRQNTWHSALHIVNPKKLETGKRTNSAGIPYALLLRVEAIWFPTFGLLLYDDPSCHNKEVLRSVV